MKINAIKVITYDVDAVMETIADMNGIPIEEVSEEEARELIYGFAIEDFGDTWGVIFQDENGNEL